MALNQYTEQLFKGFSKLNREERLQRLLAMGALTEDDIAHLTAEENLSTALADKLIENVIGYFHMPLGIATNFRINQRDYVIPMAVEETSIIAAASKTARFIRERGEIITSTEGNMAIGQIQIARVRNFDRFSAIINQEKNNLIQLANQDIAHGLVARGGGVKELVIRKIQRNEDPQQCMAVIHVHVDTCDAMGANIVNQVCEGLKYPIETLTGETVSMCILSNLTDTRLTRAQVILEQIEPDLAEKLEEASLFAEHDPYRAATHNKGVLNGMDAVLIATGNDWRAVEAGVHAYAARDGQYRAISRWRRSGSALVGILEAPVIVGTVGGVTRLHPTAQICMSMLDVKHAYELAEIIAAVGIVQNLGAIRALTTVGIIEGHMKLHISNLSLTAGALEHEIPVVEARLREILSKTQRISLQHAIDVLHDIRRTGTLHA